MIVGSPGSIAISGENIDDEPPLGLRGAGLQERIKTFQRTIPLGQCRIDPGELRYFLGLSMPATSKKFDLTP